MIYTVTLNPALDYVLRVDNYIAGKINRSSFSELFYGGKGINTSAVLTNLGVDNIALGFVGGFVGKELERILNTKGIKTDFTYLEKQNTRINIKIKSQMETEINAQGPQVSEKEVKDFLIKTENLSDGDFITLSGSIPSSVPKDIYVKIMKILSKKKVNVIVDAEKAFLTDTLMHKPFLIKPNHYELGDIFEKNFESKDEIIDAAINLQKMGAKNVMVSMAEKGGIFLSETGKIYYSPAPCGKVINSTGAGDSVIAGFLEEYAKSFDYKNSFIRGICAGSASAFSEKLATKDEIDILYKKFPFEKIEEI